MLFKLFFIFRSGSHFVQWSRTILAIFVEGHPITFLWNYFEIGPLVYEDILFKGFSIFSSGDYWTVEQNDFSNFGR